MSNIRFYLGQNYESLRHDCLQRRKLFCDDTFPADDGSISKLDSKKKPYEILWLRPHEIVSNPKFIVNEIKPRNIVQGDTGNCWFISAVVTLASMPNYCRFIIPSDQTFDKSTYAGIFHFRFWQFGEWIDVSVDDRLPFNPDTMSLIYCRNDIDENEFFGPLLEKAYAKLASCYEFLNEGDPTDALTDLTGAVCETFDIKRCIEKTQPFTDSNDSEQETPGLKKDIEMSIEKDEFNDEKMSEQSTDLDSLWSLMKRSFRMKSLMNVSLNGANKKLDKRGHLFNGLVPDHAYSILQAVEFPDPFNETEKDLRLQLIKLRNPCGNEKAWRGAYSKDSKKFRKLPWIIKKRYEIELEPRGEFYMTFKDFVSNFDELTIAHVNPSAFSAFNTSMIWTLSQLYGEWKPNHNSGGYELTTYWSNPQYLIHINNTNESDSSLIISLMQSYSARLRYTTNGSYQNSFTPIKFHLYAVNESAHVKENHIIKRQKFNDDSHLELVDSSGAYASQRSVTKRCYFSSVNGYFLIIPSSYYFNYQTRYLLRIFHDQFSVGLICELN